MKLQRLPLLLAALAAAMGVAAPEQAAAQTGAAAPAAAPKTGTQRVQLAGSMGGKALLVIDGQPRTVAVGETQAGVRLLSLSDGVAQVEQGGRVSTLRLGEAQVTVGGAPRQVGAREVALTAGLGGHFVTLGAINDHAVQFMVDTGASSVALSRSEAERIGLDLRDAPRAMTSTANGPVPVQTVTLGSVRIGDIAVTNVSAIVLPANMPYVLLGNSFLSRFQMRRDNDVMRLELKP